MLIIANGMPRSGSTLLYNLLVRYSVDYREVKSIGFVSSSDFESMKHEIEAAIQSDDLYILKTHSDTPDYLRALEISGRVFHFYTHRDIGDIGLSMQRIWNKSEDEIVERLNETTEIARRMQADPAVHVVGYNAITSQNSDVLRAMLGVMSLPYDPERVARVIQETKDGRDAKPGRLARVLMGWNVIIRNTNKTFKIGNLLRCIVPHNLVRLLRNKLIIYDRKTLILPGHSAATTQSVVDIDLAERLREQFRDWQRQFGY